MRSKFQIASLTNSLDLGRPALISCPGGRERRPAQMRPFVLPRRTGVVRSATLLLAGTMALGAFNVLPAVNRIPGPQDARVTGGSVMVVGGGAVTPDIRKQFVELAGGAAARIVLIPGSDPTPEDREKLLAPWRASGMASIVLIHAENRKMANNPGFCLPLESATGVWFGGGDQALLSDRYVDSAVQKCLHDVLRRNGVVGGSSAGAAVLSRVMIREGDMTPIESRGLNLISRAIFDQHFLARNRLWRLEQMLKSHPDLIGLGVDEATGLVIDLQSWRFRVVGESYVIACLPRSGADERRIEILKPGDDVMLSQITDEHLAFQFPAKADAQTPPAQP